MLSHKQGQTDCSMQQAGKESSFPTFIQPGLQPTQVQQRLRHPQAHEAVASRAHAAVQHAQHPQHAETLLGLTCACVCASGVGGFVSMKKALSLAWIGSQ